MSQPGLFSDTDEGQLNKASAPLANRMRPRRLEDYCGQQHLLGKDKPLRQLIESGRAHSLILWGPPGTGKTTLGRMLADYSEAQFIPLSAVLAGVKDIRAALQQAHLHRQRHGQGTVLFVDEVHRFNKAQQDAFLPHVEDGTFMFVGATTENPSFELNSALLSRARVFVLKPLEKPELQEILLQACVDHDKGLGLAPENIETGVLELLAAAADGDARRGLNLLEMAEGLTAGERENRRITVEHVEQLLEQGGSRRFDKGGDVFYDQISALHKSIRGSDPDASLYWLARMLDGGCDPIYLARRLTRIASEDIGNADPRALTLCIDAWEAQRRLGSPEGELALAQATVYLASVPKSNAVYRAFEDAMADARAGGSLPVPKHLRNAPTALMKRLGHGQNYRYAHDENDAYAAGEHYFPDEMAAKRYYSPVERGLEIRIAERLRRLRKRDSENTETHPQQLTGKDTNGDTPAGR